MTIKKDDLDRLARGQSVLQRAGEAGEPYILVTDTHVIASGNCEWFNAILDQAQRQLNDLRVSPPKPALDPHLH